MLTNFCQGNRLVIAKPLSNNLRYDSTHGHHRWSIPKQIGVKDGVTLYSQQKQNLELTMTKVGNYYCKIQA